MGCQIYGGGFTSLGFFPNGSVGIHAKIALSVGAYSWVGVRWSRQIKKYIGEIGHEEEEEEEEEEEDRAFCRTGLSTSSTMGLPLQVLDMQH